MLRKLLHPAVREDRVLEWLTASAIMAVGAFLALPFNAVSSWAAPWWFSELWLGVAVFGSGAINFGMLVINGSDDRTPTWRVRSLAFAMLCLGALQLVTLADGYGCVDALTPALLIVMVGMCIRRAAIDAELVRARQHVGLPNSHR